jgi:hypothetical protein
MDKIAELAQAKAMLGTANSVPLKPVLLTLSNLQTKLAVTPGTRGARAEAAKLVSNILEEFNLTDKFQAALGTRIPAEVAESIKQQLQREANFSGRVVDDPINGVFKSAAGAMRTTIEKSLKTPQLRARYSKLMQKASAKLDALKELRTRLGATERTVGGTAQLDTGHTESFLSNLLGKSKTRENTLLQRLDDRFGTKFGKRGQEAAAIQAFGGTEQLTSIVPGKITATGAFLGGSLGAGVGAAAGGTLGAAGVGGTIGSGLGILAASPRSTVLGARAIDAITKGTGVAERKMMRIPARLSPSAQTAISTGLRVREVPEQETAPEPEAAMRSPAGQLADEINALPNLTFEQRLQMYNERSQQEAQ